jgi:hypothetical protein
MRALWIVCNVLFLAMFLFSVAVRAARPSSLDGDVRPALACLLELTRNKRWSLPAGIGLIASAGRQHHPASARVRIADLFAEFG